MSKWQIEEDCDDKIYQHSYDETKFEKIIKNDKIIEKSCNVEIVDEWKNKYIVINAECEHKYKSGKRSFSTDKKHIYIPVDTTYEELLQIIAERYDVEYKYIEKVIITNKHYIKKREKITMETLVVDIMTTEDEIYLMFSR